mgnify:CR=1 FL=1
MDQIARFLNGFIRDIKLHLNIMHNSIMQIE